jgi:hypothetical protein
MNKNKRFQKGRDCEEVIIIIVIMCRRRHEIPAGYLVKCRKC